MAIGDSSQTEGDNALAMGSKAYAGGLNSFSFGNGARALGDGCYAIGSYKVDTGGFLMRTAPTIADGIYSVAIGQGATTGGGYANFAIGAGANAHSRRYGLAIGHNAIASGEESISLGNMGSYTIPPFLMLIYSPNVAKGFRSMALGFANHADTAYSVCLGTANRVMGIYGTGIGYLNKVYGQYAIAAGKELEAKAFGSFVVGALNEAEGDSSRWVQTDPLFVVGNGYRQYPATIRRNAFVVYKNGNAYVQGNLGIGTKDPKSLLHVASAGNMGEILVTPTALNQSSRIFLGENPSGDFGMTIQYDGNSNQLKIFGEVNDSEYGPWLLVNRNDGEIRMPQVYNDIVGSNNKALYIDDQGKIGYLSSSRRYKRAIRPMEDPGWLYRLRPVNFVYKDDPRGRMQYGLIAEEVAKVNPLFVSYDGKGRPETVAYDKLITPMLKALQEQQAEIERLKRQNEQLQARLEKIGKEKKELAALRREVDALKKILGAMAEK